MKLSEGFRLRCSTIILLIGLSKCVSPFPNVTPLGSSGKEALVITSTEAATTAPDNEVSSGESWETGDHETLNNATTESSKVVKPEIYSFRIQSDIKYRYSRTYVTSRVANLDAKRAQETTFRVVLPEAAFISKFVMEIDGKAYEAYVKEKDEAKQVYQQAQSQGQSAGLVEVSTRNSNIFNVNVNIKPESKITFNLTYEELLSRKLGRYEQSINISPEQLTSVKDFQIVVNIEESQNITSLRVPNLRNDLEALEDAEGNNADAVIVRPAGNKANITWSPSVKDQEMLSDQGISGKFVVQYDINRESNSGEILLMEGYFVHFFAPEDLPPLRKHVVFVLDISGSMWGRKMEQLKDSQKKILDDLSPEDFFNIITFSGDVSLWTPPSDDIPENGYGRPRSISSSSLSERNSVPYPATKENIAKAKTFIESLVPNGGTNIHDSVITALNLTKRIKDARDGLAPEKISYEALPTALPQEDTTGTTLQPSFDDAAVATSTDSNTPEGPVTGILPPNVESLIIFLTDGEPTVGVTDPALIQKLIQTANTNLTIPIFSLGFGEGADFPFLRKLSLQNYGFGRKIYEASDAALQLKGFYNEIASPLLSKVAFNYTSPEYNITDVTLTDFPTIFHGNEVIVAGKIVPVPYDSAFSSDDEVESSTVADNIAQADSVTEVTEISGTDSPVVFDDAPPMPSDNGLIVPNRNLLEVSISGSGRNGQIDFDRPQLFCGFNPNLRPFPARPTPPPTQEDQFLERLWAYLTIKQLIDRDLKDDVEPTNTYYEDQANPKTPNMFNETITKKKETPKEQAIRLALKYKFVTPFTSLVVVKPNSSDVTDTVSSDAKPDYADSFAAPQSMAHFAALPPPGSFSASHRIAASPARPYLQSSYHTKQALGIRGTISPPNYVSYGSYPANYRPIPLKISGGGPPTYLFASTTARNPYPIRPESIMASSFMEAEEDFSISSELSPTTSTPNEEETSTADSQQSSSESNLSLSNIVWFNPKSVVLRINETDYTIAVNSTTSGEDDEGKSCEISSDSGSQIGQCQHLRTCVQPEFVNSMDTFIDSYFCSIKSNGTPKSFVGVCCPRKERSSKLEDP